LAWIRELVVSGEAARIAEAAGLAVDLGETS
jgi:hypothetical protein